MKFIGCTTVTMIVLSLSFLWKGFVLSSLWKWFGVDCLGFTSITIPEAIGISLMVGLLTNHRSPKKDDRTFNEVLFSSFFSGITYYSLVLFIGWVVTLFT